MMFCRLWRKIFSKTYNEEDFTKLYNGNTETNDYNKVKEIEILTKTNKIMNQQQTDVSEISDIKGTYNNEKTQHLVYLYNHRQ